MSKNEGERSNITEFVWYSYLTTGSAPDYVSAPWFASKRLRPLFRRLPSEPRCKFCYYPFKGIGGSFMKALGVHPSRLNPYLCNRCEIFAERFQGGAEVELSILFADVRGSTSLAEKMNPTEFSRLINRFYNAVTQVLYHTGAWVEKLIGDAVTGFYTPGFAGSNHARVAVDAARQILHATGHEDPSGPWVPVGIGVHTGLAYVGAVNSDAGVTDIAVLGDTANLGARLASVSRAGEITVSQDTAVSAGIDVSTLETRRLDLKGLSRQVEVGVIKV